MVCVSTVYSTLSQARRTLIKMGYTELCNVQLYQTKSFLTILYLDISISKQKHLLTNFMANKKGIFKIGGFVITHIKAI